MLLRRLSALAATASLLSPAFADNAAQPQADAKPKPEKKQPDPARVYDRMVQKVAGMVNDDRAYNIATAQGLNLLDVMWEDTGRWEGSSVGPNISDVTIEVEGYSKGKQHHTYLMPVMRYDNFTDKTADLKIDKIVIPVGNQRENGKLELVSLKELLDSPEQFMSTTDKGKIKSGSLLAKRDTHVLVSAQHAFLPVPKEGKATFWPVIFNYQSTKKNPAVLAILVTRQGTSMTIIDNNRDSIGNDWGQRLFFNSGGKKAPLIAERLTDVKEKGVTANGEDAQNLSDDSNVLMLIQVPLKYRAPKPSPMKMAKKEAEYAPMAMAEGKAMAAPSASKSGGGGGYAVERSDVDTAVLGHGPEDGPFVELDGQTITRDPRFPVRVTLQFYQATSNGVINKSNVKAMAAQIKKVYGKGDYVGSLVVPSGVDRRRPTNWTDVGPMPATASLEDFPGLVERWGLVKKWPRFAIY
ncbi:MAG TPA: hypothetical protein VL326_36645 [Kofleriaceae bacterium]|jgi:hypothetical protein|nr:hypothetical protein [Kofleriaceae bacterium]